MNASRAKFLLGSLSAVAVGGCGGAVSSLSRGIAPSANDGVLSPDSIAVTYVRKNRRSMMHHGTVHPAGSKIYRYGTYLVQDGPNYETFPQSSTLYRDASGVHAYNDISGITIAFSRLAKVVLVADAVEHVVGPNEAISPYLQARIKAGQAQLVATTATFSISRHVSEFDQTNTVDDFGDGGYAIAWTGSNQIRSANNQCMGGGENIGITYTVPDEYVSNVTVTQCVDNGTPGGNVCVPFRDQVPGSTHTVSIWVSGHGPPGISMGIQSRSGTKEGVGWAFLGGCS